VNIAARLEGICKVGGICVSEDVYRQVGDKIEVKFVDNGEQCLKNISRPMRVYNITSAHAVTTTNRTEYEKRPCHANDGAPSFAG